MPNSGWFLITLEWREVRSGGVSVCVCVCAGNLHSAPAAPVHAMGGCMYAGYFRGVTSCAHPFQMT